MNDDEEDVIDSFDEDVENFDSFDNEGMTLGDALRDKPIIKFAIFGAVILVIILVITFLRSEEEALVSSLPETAEVSSPPGTEEVSQNIRDALEETDQARLEEAERTGGSALPTLIEPPVGTIALPEEEQQEEDPLQRWRRLQQERIQQEAQRIQVAEPRSVTEEVPQENIQALADAMATQMQAILDNSQEDVELTSIQITPDDYLERLAEEAAAEAAEAAANNADTNTGTGADTNNEPRIAEIIIPAGEIEYAQLLLEANSDVPGPVLVRLASGPLRGSRIIGGFEVQGERLTLNFGTLVVDGISQDINAIAIDPQTSLPALSSEVNRRYFTRVVLPAAAAFIEGAAEAIADSGQTTITIDGNATTTTTDTDDVDTEEEIASGIEEAANEISDVLDDAASNTPILVKLNAGTPIGLLFLEPVVQQN